MSQPPRPHGPWPHTPPPGFPPGPWQPWPGQWRPPPEGRSSGKAAAIALAGLHCALVAVTALLTLIVVFVAVDDPHDQCKIHGINCDRGAHLRQHVLTGVIGSAVLILLDIVLMIILWRKRPDLAFLVPLVCCMGQFLVAGAVVFHGAS